MVPTAAPIAHPSAHPSASLPAANIYAELCARFAWQVPQQLNIATLICDRHADDASRVAMIYESEDGTVTQHSFAEFRSRSNQLAHALRKLGVERGDRVGIVMSQRPETAIAHLAIYKLGAIVLPMAALFGPEALEYRLRTAGVRVALTDAMSLDRLIEVQSKLPALTHLISADSADAPDVHNFVALIADESTQFETVATNAEDPALLIFTSGTTGPPKGALHAHRMMPGRMPSMEFVHQGFPKAGDRFWTPADWAWAGGLLDMLLPSWYHGVTVVAYRSRKFDVARAYELMARHQIRNVFLPATVLKMMRQFGDPRSASGAKWNVKLRTIHTGGETTGEEVIRWAEQALGATPHEAFGQTEAVMIIGNCADVMPIKPGALGRPIPGHDIALLDANGAPHPADAINTPGEIALKRGAPGMFLRYWNDEATTREKFSGDWLLTGDLARKDEDGYLWYVGRKDDVISSGAYRIGPGEIEACLTGHPAVALAAAVGSPDPIRGEVVKAFVQLREGFAPSPALAQELQAHVRTRLSAHEYPREIEFYDSIPTTTTGKVMRKELRALEHARKKAHPAG